MQFCHADAVSAACHLIRYPSITPTDSGCLKELGAELQAMGFDVHIKVFDDTTNLFALWGQGGRHVCFAGHVDVVPPGPLDQWNTDPFDPVQHNGCLYGRGAADMKGAIACFLSAMAEHIACMDPLTGTISLLLTSDEEGLGINGVPKMIPWMKENKYTPDFFLIGEPTGNTVGSVLQVGRRGSLLGKVHISGVQGHIAYPRCVDNPIHRFQQCLSALLAMNEDYMDKGNDVFEPSYLAVTYAGTDNVAENVTPGNAYINFGVRFNPLQTVDTLRQEIERRCAGLASSLDFRISGHPFVTTDQSLIDLCIAAVHKATGMTPELSTRGGVTDGRFLHVLAPVIELGMAEDTIHQVNEHVVTEELYRLKRCYARILKDFFIEDVRFHS